MKVPVILVRYYGNFIFFDIFSKNTQISNFTKILPAGFELFHAGRWKHRRAGVTKLIFPLLSSFNAPANWPQATFYYMDNSLSQYINKLHNLTCTVYNSSRRHFARPSSPTLNALQASCTWVSGLSHCETWSKLSAGRPSPSRIGLVLYLCVPSVPAMSHDGLKAIFYQLSTDFMCKIFPAVPATSSLKQIFKIINF